MNTLKHSSTPNDIKNDSVFSMSHLPTVGKMKLTAVYKLKVIQVVIVLYTQKLAVVYGLKHSLRIYD